MRISVWTAFFLAASVSAASADEMLTNGSFESPALGSTAYVYPGNANPALSGGYAATVDAWTYGGSALVNTSVGSNAWYGGTAPAGYDGLQFAALQATSSLSQTFDSPLASSAEITWLDAGRPDFGSVAGDQSYDVLLNGNVLGTFSTVSGQAFTLETTTADLLAGSNILSFVGLSTADQTAFIDRASVNSVPEPLTLSLFGAGLAGIGVLRRRKHAGKA